MEGNVLGSLTIYFHGVLFTHDNSTFLTQYNKFQLVSTHKTLGRQAQTRFQHIIQRRVHCLYIDIYSKQINVDKFRIYFFRLHAAKLEFHKTAAMIHQKR